MSNGVFFAHIGQPQLRILDVGCDTDLVAHRLQAHGYEVVAIDESAELVQQTRALGVDAHLAAWPSFVDTPFDRQLLIYLDRVLAALPLYDQQLAWLERSRVGAVDTDASLASCAGRLKLDRVITSGAADQQRLYVGKAEVGHQLPATGRTAPPVVGVMLVESLALLLEAP